MLNVIWQRCVVIIISAGKWGWRVLGGWLPIGSVPASKWLGKIIWVGGLIAAGLFVYHHITRPTTENNQRATTIINHYHQPKVSFGCANTRVIEYKKQKKYEQISQKSP